MRQLTSVDAQFLALETARQTGHVGGLAILDPSTRPDGKLTLEAIHDLIAERLPLLPPLRWRLAEVPFGLDYPYWVDDPDFDLDFHVRELALLAARQRREAGRAGGAHRRAPARPRAPALGDLPDPRARSRPRGDADEDPPLADRRPLGRGDHGRAARPRRPRAARPPSRSPAAPTASRPRSRCSRAGCSACRATRCGSCARCRPRCRTSTRRRSARCPGAGVAARVADVVSRALSRGDGGVLERTDAQGAAHDLQRAHLAAPALRRSAGSRSTRSRRSRTATAARSTTWWSSICAGAVRRWLEEHDELPDEPLVAQIPVSVRTSEQAGTYGNRIMLMSAPLFTERRGPGGAPAADARGAARR